MAHRGTQFVVADVSVFLKILSFVLVGMLAGKYSCGRLLRGHPSFLLTKRFDRFKGDLKCKRRCGAERVSISPLLARNSNIRLLCSGSCSRFSPVSRRLRGGLRGVSNVS